MGLVKNAVLRAAASRPFHRLLALLEQAQRAKPDLLAVLTYHRVDELTARPDLDPTLLSATPDEFDRQMSYLAAGYRVLSLPELLERQMSGRPLPPRAVLITFDDAYQDFAEHAWPILQRHRLPATLFVPTAFPDNPALSFWWDRVYQSVTQTQCAELSVRDRVFPLRTPAHRQRAFRHVLHALKRVPHQEAMQWVEQLCATLRAAPARPAVMSWDTIRRLASDGMTLGGHTRTHPLLTRLRPAEACAEVLGSLEDLSRETGSALNAVAYPGGAINAEVTRLLRSRGLRVGFTTARGLNQLGTADPLRLRRIHVGRRTTHSILRAQLLPWCLHLNRWQPVDKN